jgi:hypothetical protein
MKRLWRGKGLDGLLVRRDREAALFEAGLRQRPAPSQVPPTIPPSKPSVVTVQRIGWGAAVVATFGALAHWVGGHPVITAAAVIAVVLAVLYILKNPQQGDIKS